jgi:Multidrug resistance efflux pump
MTRLRVTRTSKNRYHGITAGFRSGLEEKIAEDLKRRSIDAKYEEVKIKYIKPSKPATYTPDFVLPNGVIVETKGRFVTADRQKHLLIKDQHPDLNIRFLFQNSRARISKTSKTTYADWCRKNGFEFADRVIPEEWLK